jgi:hypothetical protein
MRNWLKWNMCTLENYAAVKMKKTGVPENPALMKQRRED